ncbi:hypothetical protein [Spirilliplanes yamanashiensis]|uniref:Uncharacterized protein n=1 Tax=Spirilliplanes yamanashiensis TaxID=42233 RepID=A0A8J4DI09_9ACTN|nr:hypothetical protein [Spirilliplanes yamanashiensis]MDP9819620.1 hypothetical protein [Spirilliplanes yamanashiensis]GIJ01560.1 hypothetical protein Sya03_09120 [Spirilliplanes yamanashiensis]
MTGVALHLRARRVPAALVAGALSTAILWAAWVWLSDAAEIAVEVTVPAILFAVAAAATTLGGADEDLERTAARRWPPRRALHLLAALSAVLLLVVAAELTATSFAGPRIVLRDAAGLLGLAALGAVASGASRAWFGPVAWALAAIALRGGESTAMQVVTWPVQPETSRAATVTAAVLAVAGGVAYAVRGARARPAD